MAMLLRLRPDPDRLRAASTVGRATELQAIRLLKIDSFVGGASELAIQSDTLVYEWVARYNFVEEGSRLMVQIELGLKSLGAKQSKAGDQGVGIRATYELAYEFKCPPPPHDLRDFFFEGFANISAVHHVWPFWRELVFSLSQRFGIDAIVLPLIKFQPEAAEAAETPKKPKKKAAARPRLAAGKRDEPGENAKQKRKARPKGAN
jgi:hypothetical protein